MKDILKRALSKRMKKKGFTLVELLVVIAIIAVLAAVAVVTYMGFTEQARKSVDQQLCTQYNTLLAAKRVGETDDITLGEAIIYFEEGGINSNYFATSSSSYVFAYNEEDNRCVLLDKSSGNVQYPEGASYKADELWALWPETNYFQKGINNYTLLDRSLELSLDSVTLLEGVTTYGIDLNNNAILVQSVTKDYSGYTFNLKNGPYAIVGNSGTGTLANFATDEGGTAYEIAEDSLHITDKANFESDADAKAILTASDNEEKVVSKQYFAGSSSGSNVTVKVYGNPKSFTFQECIFTNVTAHYLACNVDGVSIVFENCKFFNSPTNGALLLYWQDNRTNPSASLKINNCDFYNCSRGMNICALTSGNIEITNNTFEFIEVPQDSIDARRDDAIQLAPCNEVGSRDKFSTAAFDEKNTAKITISGNTMVHGNGFITPHHSMKTLVGTEYNKTIDEVKAYFSKVLDIHDNVIPSETKTLTPYYDDTKLNDGYWAIYNHIETLIH